MTTVMKDVDKNRGNRMKMVIDNLDKVMAELKHVQIEKFPDNQLNQLYNYWFSRLAERFHEVYGVDAGIDQQQFMILEELDQRLDSVDWAIVEKL